jgi:hypothetical protein
MKTVMISFIIALILIMGCNDQVDPDLSKNCVDCENELNKESIQNLTCKVAKFNDEIFVLTYDSISFANSGYVVGSESILVPCDFPDSLKIPETIIKVNGQIVNDCCGILTLPQIRVGFGCKFYITEIFN